MNVYLDTRRIEMLTYLEDFCWLCKKRLFLFALIYIFKMFFIFFNKKVEWDIFKKLNLGTKETITHIGSIKMLLRFYDLWNVKEIYLLKIYDHLKIPKNAVVLDVGAYIGLFTLKVAKKAKSVISIEPLAENFLILKKNTALNHLTNIRLLNAAVWKKTGYITLCGEWGGASFFQKNTVKRRVKTIKLNNITKNINKIDLIKIDVEGAEEAIVQSSKKTLLKTEQIIIEVHPLLINESKLLSKLKEVGFILKKFPSHIQNTYLLFGKNLYLTHN